MLNICILLYTDATKYKTSISLLNKVDALQIYIHIFNKYKLLYIRVYIYKVYNNMNIV